MKHKYWAKHRYSLINPVEYEKDRFVSHAGIYIDNVEKSAVLELINKSRLSHKKVLNILDVATGTGRLSFYLEKKFNNSNIVGLDINKNMLQLAFRKKKRLKSKVQFIIGDVYHLPFSNNSFDIVVGLRYSMHLPNLESVLCEIMRVTKQNGIVIFDIFNINSILGFKIKKKSDAINYGFYSKSQIIRQFGSRGFRLIDFKGILLFGETLLRKMPEKYLKYCKLILNPPHFLQNYSSKIILKFQKK